jgi:quinol monooxygenase YgiN
MSIVSIHPYFKIKPGKTEAVKATAKSLVSLCQPEPGCQYFGFSFDGDQMFCREAYEGAEGVLAHLENAGEAMAPIFENAELIKLEVHGTAEELEKLKAPLAELNPTYFVLELGD